MEKPEKKPLGINHLKAFLFAFVSVLLALFNVTKSNKRDFRLWGALIEQMSNLRQIVGFAPQAKEEFLDLDGDESTELVDEFAVQFEMKNEEAEELVEEGLDLALSGFVYLKKLIAYSKREKPEELRAEDKLHPNTVTRMLA